MNTIENNNVKFKKLTPFATAPTSGTAASAGWDLYAADSMSVEPGEFIKVPTDIAIAIPNGYFGAVYSRSSVGTKGGLRVCQGVAVIDSDYRGNLIVPLYNQSKETKIVNRGDRIAQLVIQPYLQVRLELVDELDETERGEGGFGSTGV